jgi:hypothetical protein
VILAGLLIMFSFPVSLMFGVTGIIFDRRKWLAIITTVTTGGLVFVYLYAMAITSWRF